MAIKTVQTSVAFTDPQNNVLANGSITLDLSQQTIVSTGGDVVPSKVSLPLDNTGKIANQPVNLWANDQLSPSGTTYHMRAFNSNGLQVADYGQISITGSSPIDLSLLTPALATPNLSVTNVPFIVARFYSGGLTANVNTTTLYAVPSSGAGMYRLSGYIFITQAATNSSTLPNLQAVYTDLNSSVVETITMTVTATGNSLGLFGFMSGSSGIGNPAVFAAAANTNIQYQTTGYATSGATPLSYAFRLTLEYLG